MNRTGGSSKPLTPSNLAKNNRDLTGMRTSDRQQEVKTTHIGDNSEIIPLQRRSPNWLEEDVSNVRSVELLFGKSVLSAMVDGEKQCNTEMPGN